RLDEVVDVRVERGEVAAGSGRDPSAQRGELERLGEVPQRQAVRTQLILEGGAEDAGLDARGARSAVDLEHAVEMAEIDGHGAPVDIADPRFDTTHDARAAAVGNRRGARVGTP